MPLATGTRFGPYEISAQIGAGGMGEVYRATDRNLSRQVAIKVLPHSVAADADRLARFDREAKALAALNHPNIAAIYGVERNDGTTALVMELVEGPTLADRILQGAIPVHEAIRIAREIADALETAHEQGIVHRDLKPANIKQHRNGTVKVLDFGLAKTTQTANALASAPTITSPAVTETGIILGTAAYMSPEQAKGLAVDQRCDVWAFACVLYEMLTGRRAFPGHTVTETLAAILERDVDWSHLPPSTPASVRTLLRRALAKDPRRRLHHIADARLELEEAHAAPERVTTESRRVPWQWIAIASVAVIAIVAGTWRVSSSSSTIVPMPTARLSFVPEPALSAKAENPLAMSPDGQHIAYVGGRDDLLYIRDIDRFDTRALPGTEGANMPAFSPDGQWIAFQANDKIKKVSLAGGSPITLADSAEGHGIGWESNDSILFKPGRATGIWRLSAAGVPQPQQVTTVRPGENSHAEAEGLPGGEAIVYRTNGGTTLQLYAQSLVTGQRHLIGRGSNPHYLRSGHIAYVQDSTLIVAPFDIARLEKTGPPTVVATGVREMGTGTAQVTVSQTGSIAYVPAPGGRRDTLVWVDSSGVEQPTTIAGEAFRMPRLSPDQTRLIVHIGSASGAGQDLWIYNLATNRRNRVSFDGASTFPLWDPRGAERIILSSRHKSGSFQVLTKTLDGTAPDTFMVTQHPTDYPLSWSPDGRFVAVVGIEPETNTDIWVLTLGSSPTWQPFLKTSFREGAPTFSHDGRLIGYASDSSGRGEIYVKAFPAGGAEVAVSINGGTEPLFARGAPTLFYRHGDEMLAVDITAGPPITVGSPRVVFKRPYERGDGVWPNYDVTPDGRRLLMIRSTEQEAPSRVNVVLNWLDDLKRPAPAK